MYESNQFFIPFTPFIFLPFIYPNVIKEYKCLTTYPFNEGFYPAFG
jgi:hypothetical protein